MENGTRERVGCDRFLERRRSLVGRKAEFFFTRKDRESTEEKEGAIFMETERGSLKKRSSWAECF